MYKTLPLLLLLTMFATSFQQGDNSAVVKGKIKRVDNYLSGTHRDYLYDMEGRLVSSQMPYGEKQTRAYYANFVFIETVNSGGETRYDTLVMKAANLVEKGISARYTWQYEYDINGNVVSETYVPLKGKKRKPGKPGNSYTFSYYCDKANSAPADSSIYPCDNYQKVPLVKTVVGVTAKGDTNYYFYYKYLFDKAGRVETRMMYYRTGQLYDSVGYVYY